MKLYSRKELSSEDTVELARSLIGAYLITNLKGKKTGGCIVETEAYKAPEDKASHAHLNRRTKRTEVMFGKPGNAYIYLCYGIHHLFNIVTGPEGKAHAVLVRALEPLWGLELMKERRNTNKKKILTNGPGKLSEALGIKTNWTGTDLLIEDNEIQLFHSPSDKDISIISAKRIGVDYAGESKDWPWRFYDEQSDFVSKR